MQPQRRVGRTGGVGGAPLAAVHGPLGGLAAVLEHRLADDLDLDAALNALDHAHQHVVGLVVGGRTRPEGLIGGVAAPRSDRERVAYDQPARRRQPGGLDDQRARDVADAERHHQPVRPDTERAGATVEQRAENARRVEPRHAHPLDAAVRRDQRAGLAVRQERVVRDRRKRRSAGQRLVMRWERDRRRHASPRNTNRWRGSEPQVAAEDGKPGQARGRVRQPAGKGRHTGRRDQRRQIVSTTAISAASTSAQRWRQARGAHGPRSSTRSPASPSRLRAQPAPRRSDRAERREARRCRRRPATQAADLQVDPAGCGKASANSREHDQRQQHRRPDRGLSGERESWRRRR